MLQNESILTVADNSGAKKLLVIRCLGGSNRKFSRIGDLVVATVKKVDPHSNIEKGQIVIALIITSKNERNSDKEGKKGKLKLSGIKEPIGTRIFVPVLAEFNY
ncbi:21713_t:CDS:2 [Gigaspora margarita]|uniref:21713_t:CDS:1 n=1 Tax=Gigaspora margarita TaxID=4874 RepID=A0ABM8VVA9_GIGMA|nr:21713_t:CDS:2 [Gigaspora margarita]